MKMILSVILALSFIAGVAGPSFATSNVDAKKVYDRLDKESRGGHQT